MVITVPNERFGSALGFDTRSGITDDGARLESRAFALGDGNEVAVRVDEGDERRVDAGFDGVAVKHATEIIRGDGLRWEVRNC